METMGSMRSITIAEAVVVAAVTVSLVVVGADAEDIGVTAAKAADVAVEVIAEIAVAEKEATAGVAEADSEAAIVDEVMYKQHQHNRSYAADPA